ncbi:MAG TPA: hypothetical protein VL172_07505, partial [Kofleriaceae bacterium]|nr:hypothetical protein [Kofleriaceae bacterium]
TVLLVVAASPAARDWLGSPPPRRDTPVSFAEVQGIVTTRCVPCHAVTPSVPGFTSAPKGLILEKPEQIQAQAGKIDSFAVQTTTMPLGNLTQITDAERATLGAWIAQGAKLE